MSTDDERRMSVGTAVTLQNDRGARGIIREVRERADGNADCLVFFTSEHQGWYLEDNLVVASDAATDHPEYVTASQFLKDMAVVKLQNQLTDTFYSYLASRTNVEPYQFKPALKFLENPSQRIILADEVGLGKTIEAGIIYLELKARQDMRRVLIVCPSGLRQKWRDEMMSRFDEEFAIYDASQFIEFLEQYERRRGDHEIRAIVSLESLRRIDIEERIQSVGLSLDLVIVDEAHHMRNPDTRSYGIGMALSDAAVAMLLLTATPVQLRSDDLFHILHILDEGEFEAIDEFQELLEPNAHINRSLQLLSQNPDSYMPALEELRRVETTPQGLRYRSSSLFRRVCEQLASPPNAPDVRRYVQIRRSIQDLNTLARVFNRTTKREVDPGKPRRAHVIGVDLTAEELHFYEAVLEYAREQYRRRSGTSRYPPPFAIIQRERQAASCIAATREYILESHTDPNTSLQVEESRTELEEDGELEEGDGLGLQALLDACDRLGDKDSKLEAFLTALDQIRQETPGSKVLVFAFFKRTLNYLHGQLTSRLKASGESVRLIHGDIPQRDRPRIIEAFRVETGFGVLLLSEVGAEGLDFQFCDVVMNYDLPWNPMRVEQRIGRVDRYGQTHNSIRIYSFIINDTIEERILQRLYERIGVFEESIGELEPILGQEISNLEREIFRSQLTGDMEIQRVDAILQSIEFRRQDEEKFREEQDRLMGQDIIFNQHVDEILNSGRYISPAEIRALVESYLREEFPQASLEPNQNEPRISVFKSSPGFTDHLRDFMTRERYPIQVKRHLNDKIGGARVRGFPVTFDGQFALERPLLELINFRHPIASAAYDHYRQIGLRRPLARLGRLQSQAPPELEGDYTFYVYAMRSEGIERHRVLEPVVLDKEGVRCEAVEPKLMGLIQTSSESDRTLADGASVATLEKGAHDIFAARRDEYQRELADRNNALIETRIDGLNRTVSAKQNRLRTQRDDASDERIKRMRQGQMDRLESDLRQKIEELDQRKAVSVGGELVIAGTISLLPALEVLEAVLDDMEDELVATAPEPTPTTPDVDAVKQDDESDHAPIRDETRDVPQTPRNRFVDRLRRIVRRSHGSR